ncbi:hypothetical protein CO2235_MP130126 [Cupriavidus oxalaticus]|uniref:Uncharacterized protein n=1 Tax=Cupriavidus oxalaticus TaxID=96344 RepID=A0A976BGY2_9BURK|nr:hypothetical protein CO2235_MP130126 [Cupriavidus oxalaticus]
MASQTSTSVPAGVSRQCRVRMKPCWCATLKPLGETAIDVILAKQAPPSTGGIYVRDNPLMKPKFHEEFYLTPKFH